MQNSIRAGVSARALLLRLLCSMGLQQQLDELTAKLQAMVPAERLAVVQQAMDEIRTSGAGAHGFENRQSDSDV